MNFDHIISIAPMLDWTDRHYRYFMRLITRKTVLYTEMVTTGAILRGDCDRHLFFNKEEQPLALQLGGSDPQQLLQCSKIAEDYGYNEVNLNVGCPSDRVQSGRFGACLMKEPELVAECVASMKRAVAIPVTVKSRIGVDELDSYQALYNFVKTVSQAGCELFILHARKAWLQGLSPKENREIPELKYEVVHQIKRDFPELKIVINGGINSLEQAEAQLGKVDGVMIGREAYQNPWIFSQVDSLFYGGTDPLSVPHQLIEDLIPYIESELSKGSPLHSMTRHFLGLFHGMPGARKWRRHLSENAVKRGAGVETLITAASFVANRENGRVECSA